MTRDIIVQRMAGVVVVIFSVIVTIVTGPWTNVKSAPVKNKATESKEDFLCDNAKRISWLLKCNNVNDCKDGIGANGSDELDCDDTPTTSNTSVTVIVEIIIWVLVVAVLICIICYLLWKFWRERNFIRVNSDILLRDMFPQRRGLSRRGYVNQGNNVSTSTPCKILVERFISVLGQVGDFPFAVICINGISCDTKSYLLNLFIKKLKDLEAELSSSSGSSRGNSSNNQINNRGNEENGRLAFGPFFIKRSNGEEIAVVIMDCKGNFENNLTMADKDDIFEVTSFLSSILIFNCNEQTILQALTHIHLSSSHMRHITSTVACAGPSTSTGQPTQGHGQGNGHGHRLQKLVIMVRDFSDHDNFSYGYHNSKEPPTDSNGNFYRLYFNIENNSTGKSITCEHQEEIDGIKNNYESIGFSLQSDPGKPFKRDPSYQHPPDSDKEFSLFREKMNEFVNLLLTQEHLVTKKLDEKEITGTDFVQFVKDSRYIKSIISPTHNGNELNSVSNPKSIANHKDISYILEYEEAYNYFVEKLREFIKSLGDKKIDKAELKIKSTEIYEDALMKCTSRTSFTQFGANKMERKYDDKLFTKCQKARKEIKHNYFKIQRMRDEGQLLQPAELLQ